MPRMTRLKSAICWARSAARRALLLFVVAFLLPLMLHGLWWLSKDHPRSWRAADWSSAGLLPPVEEDLEASVRVYSAPTGRWKGVFSVHSWIVVKERGAPDYTRFDVAGWGRPVKIDNWAPDARWYGNMPQLVGVIRGPAAERLIPRIRSAVESYPHGKPGDYRIWPGPNSNTFVAAVLAEVPDARIALPSNAIGKDFRGAGLYVGLSPTRTGLQISVAGLFGLTIAWVEGLEINVLGLVTGVDFRQLAIKLPGWGALTLMPRLQASAAEIRHGVGSSGAERRQRLSKRAAAMQANSAALVMSRKGLEPALVLLELHDAETDQQHARQEHHPGRKGILVTGRNAANHAHDSQQHLERACFGHKPPNGCQTKDCSHPPASRELNFGTDLQHRQGGCEGGFRRSAIGRAGRDLQET